VDYEHLRNKLVEGYSNLSGRLQQITRYAMTHPNDMALETIAVIAKRTEVPPSSLIRFAKSFGFSGFSEMQKVFQQGLLGRMSEYQKGNKEKKFILILVISYKEVYKLYKVLEIL
jgi:DNA-binding MurR/RpiR family transcriptional regulator